MGTGSITAVAAFAALAIVAALAYAAVRRLSRRGYKVTLSLLTVTLTPASPPKVVTRAAAEPDEVYARASR